VNEELNFFLFLFLMDCEGEYKVPKDVVSRESLFHVGEKGGSRADEESPGCSLAGRVIGASQ
jgi:hypothetical protein